MDYVKVIVQRDPMEKIPVIVPAHELPILEDVHGRESLVEVPLTKKEAAQLAKQDQELRERIESERQAKADEAGEDYEPLTEREQVEAEHARLEGKYGMHPEIKQSHVEHVYGRVTTGALKAAMGLNRPKAAKADKEPKEPKEPKAPRGQAAKGDKGANEQPPA